MVNVSLLIVLFSASWSVVPRQTIRRTRHALGREVGKAFSDLDCSEVPFTGVAHPDRLIWSSNKTLQEDHQKSPHDRPEGGVYDSDEHHRAGHFESFPPLYRVHLRNDGVWKSCRHRIATHDLLVQVFKERSLGGGCVLTRENDLPNTQIILEYCWMNACPSPNRFARRAEFRL